MCGPLSPVGEEMDGLRLPSSDFHRRASRYGETYRRGNLIAPRAEFGHLMGRK